MTVVGVDLENVLRMAISELTNAGVEGAIIDSRILASAAFDLSREEILREPNATLKISDIALFKEMLNRFSFLQYNKKQTSCCYFPKSCRH